MSIKPVDLQILIPKTAEISKIHNDVQQKNQALQQQQTTATQHKAEENLRQVYSRDRAQDAKIKEKQEKEQRNKKEEKEKKEDKTNNLRKAKSSGSNMQTSTIDIRL